MTYQPKTGERCACRPGVQRDNCPDCEGTGWRLDFRAIRNRTRDLDAPFPLYPWRYLVVVGPPEAYADVLEALALAWVRPFSTLPSTEWVSKARDVVQRFAPALWNGGARA